MKKMRKKLLRIVEASQPSIIADFTMSQSYTDNPFLFTSTSVVPEGQTISLYSWDFGDGDTISGALASSISHTYTQAGSYDVTLTITVNGETYSVTQTLVVDDYPLNVYNGGPYVVGDRIRLYCDAVTGATYSWSGPNGYTSTNRNPTRANCTLDMAGTYTCTVIISGQGLVVAKSTVVVVTE